MLTVKEIAVKYSISRTAVYNKINHSMKEELKPFVIEKEGITRLLSEGVELIGQSLDKTKVESDTLNGEEHDDSMNDTNPDITRIMDKLEDLETDYMASLKEHIHRLEDELAEKNKQLAQKDQLLERNNDLLQNFQVIVRQNQERVLELEGEVKEQKQRWWQRLKWWE